MNHTNPSTEDLLRAATAFAEEAGRIAAGYFHRDLTVERKADDSPVTVADREAEQTIRKRIREYFPDHGILGEEFDPVSGSGDYTWVIDPIDGTQSFISRVPLFGVLIAVIRGAVLAGEQIAGDRVEVGIIHLPGLGETVAAGRALGCTLNGRECRVSTTDSLTQSRVACSDFLDLARREPSLYATLVDQAPFGRTWGDAFGYRAVAAGTLDAMIDPVVSIWDVAPMPVIIEESGGIFTDLSGNPVLSTTGIASNGPLHAELLAARERHVDPSGSK